MRGRCNAIGVLLRGNSWQAVSINNSTICCAYPRVERRETSHSICRSVGGKHCFGTFGFAGSTGCMNVCVYVYSWNPSIRPNLPFAASLCSAYSERPRINNSLNNYHRHQSPHNATLSLLDTEARDYCTHSHLAQQISSHLPQDQSILTHTQSQPQRARQTIRAYPKQTPSQ